MLPTQKLTPPFCITRSHDAWGEKVIRQIQRRINDLHRWSRRRRGVLLCFIGFVLDKSSSFDIRCVLCTTDRQIYHKININMKNSDRGLGDCKCLKSFVRSIDRSRERERERFFTQFIKFEIKYTCAWGGGGGYRQRNACNLELCIILYI